MQGEGLFGQLYTRLGRRLGAGLLAELKRRSVARPGWTVARAAAYAIAAVVHSITLLLVVAILLLVVKGGFLAYVLAGFLALMAWVLRPRRVPLDGEPLDRSRFPATYALFDGVAAAIGARPVRGVIVDEWYNASFRRVGLRSAYVTVGLPLLSALTAQERVALIGHELAHGVSGDSRRGWFVGSALDTLASWYAVVKPESLTSSDRGLGGLAAIPANLLFLAVAQVVYAIAWVLVHLLFRESQRAEYLADRLAAETGGTTAAVRMLTISGLGESFYRRAQGLAVNRERDVFTEWRTHVASLDHRSDPTGSRAASEDARLDSTHPPTSARIELLRAHPVADCRIVVGDSEWERIDAEFASLAPVLQRRLADVAEGSLYAG